MSMTDDPMGEVTREGDRWSLRFERRLQHGPEEVWRALTESEHLAHWLPCDIVGERRQGAPIVLPFWPEIVAKYEMTETPELHGEITVWDPPHVFEWTWDTDRLRFELSPTDGGTALVFNTWLGESSIEGPTKTAAGYHVCLAHLAQLLDTGDSPGVVDADPSELERRYDEAADAA